MSNDVVEKVAKIVAEHLGVDLAAVQLESTFIDELGADSLDVVEIVLAFEDEFGIDIPDEDAEKITKVSQAVDYINAKLGKSAAS